MMTGRLGSVDTGINTAQVQAMNEAVNYPEDQDQAVSEDDEQEDRLLLLDDTRNNNPMADAYTMALLES